MKTQPGSASDAPVVVAALGPTNTGKTHRAIERMLEHDSGMIGLPLRLLAREVYDRISTRLGERAVALVTGEEKRIPPAPRYWVCTVEAMPIERSVDFLAVDEIQMSAHSERGHVFTDRLLHARGRRETWFLGAETIRPVLARHVREAEQRRFPRLSELRGVGQLTLSALPPRSAVVSFSVDGVYRIAERLRARRGGAAVVLGALSPRARNAQVALFQSREVDFMVATDAIGMGLNLELNHVAFAELRKFDGRHARELSVAELAQVAGRAGRHLENGSFSTLAPLPPLPRELERALERHRFPALERLVWRNSSLDFSTLAALCGSLSERPSDPTLGLVEHAADFQVLGQLLRRERIQELASDADGVRLLWDVCQIPDYRHLLLDHHANLLESIFVQLREHGQLDAAWLRHNVTRLDDIQGDMDTLVARMAFVRTWTYVTHHATWVSDSATWQELTRDIEDRLSDALHERLVERFVRVRRRSVSSQQEVQAALRAGNPFGKLHALRQSYAPDTLSAAQTLAETLIDAPHEAFQLDARGRVFMEQQQVATLTRGVDILHPEVVLEHVNALGAGSTARVTRRLVAWTQDLLTELFASLREPGELNPPAVRGLLYQLEQGLGSLERKHAQAQLRAFGPAERRLLTALGVDVGRRFVLATPLFSETALRTRAALCTAFYQLGRRGAWQPAGPSVESVRDVPHEIYLRAGYAPVADLAIRVDVLERTLREMERYVAGQPFLGMATLSAWLGCGEERVPSVLKALGYRPRPQAAAATGRTAARRRRRRGARPSATASASATAKQDPLKNAGLASSQDAASRTASDEPEVREILAGSRVAP